MKKRLLTAWIIACMFICLVGQTPITALAEGDDTRVISVPEGLQEVLINETPEIQTVETEDTIEETNEVQTEVTEETNEVQDKDVAGEAQGTNGTAETPDVQTQEEAIVETLDAQTVQEDVTVETPDDQTVHEDVTAETPNAQTTEDTTAEAPEIQTVQEEIPEFIEEISLITETNLTASIVASDGNTYETNVKYTNESSIPMEGTVLQVTELVAEDEGYDEYLEESASKVGVDTKDIVFSKVFDIKIVDENDENIEYEPTGNVDVSIRVVGVPLDEIANLNVLHFVEDKNDENYLVYDVDTTIKEETVEFTTDSFSVYVVIGHEGEEVENPRVKFHFISPYLGNSLIDANNSTAYYAVDPYVFKNKNNEEQSSQILKNGEKLELIADPGNYTDRFFYGWYVVNPYICSETDDYGVGSSNSKLYYTWPANPDRISFDASLNLSDSGINIGSSVNWSMGDVSGSGIVDGDGNVHVFLAPVYEKYNFINFMLYSRDSQVNNLMTRKLIAVGSSDTVEVKISDVRSTSKDSVHLMFAGWEYNNGTSWVKVPTVDHFGDEIKEAGKDGVYLSANLSDTSSIDLYPLFVEARWIDFVSGPSGSGATFVGSRYLEAWGPATPSNTPEEEGENIFSSLDTSTRKGFAFDGWYAFANLDLNTGEITNLTTPENVTVNYIDGNYQIHTVTINTTAIPITNGSGEITYDGTFTLPISATESVDLFSATGGKLKLLDSLDRLSLTANWESSETEITIVYWTENALDDEYSASAARTISTADLSDGENYADNTDREIGSGTVITLNMLKEYLDKDYHVSVASNEILDDVGAVDKKTDPTAATAREEIFYDLNETLSDASQTIDGSGNTIYNIYFKRKVFKLVFHIGRDGYVKNSGNQKTTEGWNPYGNWIEFMFNDATLTSLLGHAGKGGASHPGVYTMTYNPTGKIATSEYVTNLNNIMGDYIPGDDENLYVIEAKYGAYIGDKWPTPVNPNFTFTNPSGSTYSMYIWAAFYGSLYCRIANERSMVGNAMGANPDINGVYSYMSAELCSDRTGNSIINENQVHHLVAWYGNANNSNRFKQYHILYEAVDGTYDAGSPTIAIHDGSEYSGYKLTTWSQEHTAGDKSEIQGKNFYEDSSNSPNLVLSNLEPQFQMGWEFDGYEYIYSCYDEDKKQNPNISGQKDYHVYFFYRPKQYHLTFMYENEADRKTDTYYFKQPLSEANVYSVPEKQGYEFLGWYTNEAGAGEPFDFANEIMPSRNLVLYPVFKKMDYIIRIDPNGAEIDHWRSGSQSSGASTGFRADYKETISSYDFLTREYVPTDSAEISSLGLNTNEVYYYYKTRYRSEAEDGRYIPSGLRDALYLTASEIDDYWAHYQSVPELSFTSRGAHKYGPTEKDAWMDAYFGGHDLSTLQKYRETRGAEHYSFMGWYQVINGKVSSVPFNFNTLVTDDIEIRAMWRLDGGYYLLYNPEYYATDSNNETVRILGNINQWTDPENPSIQVYADQSHTQVLHAPTNVPSGWVFRGWFIVKPNGTGQYTDSEGTHDYTIWEPVQLDENGDPVYYQPGDDLIVDSQYVSDNPQGGAGAVIHIQAYYEQEESSHRRPDITNLILDANDGNNGYISNITSELPGLSRPGHQSIDKDNNLYNGHPTQILIGDIQSNLALHLYRYATTKTYNGIQGTNFFSHNNGYLLIGFDENEDPMNPTTGKSYIPAYAADSVASVTRNETNKVLYAMWEPMVYVTFVNTTEQDLVIDLSGTGGTVSIVNKATGEFDRESATTQITVPAKSGTENGEVKVVLPGAIPGTDSITATTKNTHLGYRLSVNGVFDTQNPYGTGTTEAYYNHMATYKGILQTDSTGIVVTYSEEEDPSVIFDVNGGVWEETEPLFVQSPADTDVYTIKETDVNTINRYEPADPTHTGKAFIGWTLNADIASQTDFSSDGPVTFGSTNITPGEDEIVLDKIRSDYLWDFTQPAPYGQILYAIWSDTVTVTFDIVRTGSNLHTWEGPATTTTQGLNVFYRSSNSSGSITYTLIKGERVPMPSDPTTNQTGWFFVNWIQDDTSLRNTTTNLENNTVLFKSYAFSKRVKSPMTLSTSWTKTQPQTFTFIVNNSVIGGSANEEFDYTIEVLDEMVFGKKKSGDGNTAHVPTIRWGSVSTKLKNNENYTIKVTVLKITPSGWSFPGYSVNIDVIDRDNVTIKSGHMIYCEGGKYKNYVSDWKYTLKITQDAKTGYDTTVTRDVTQGTVTNNEADSATRSYTFSANQYSSTNNSVATSNFGPSSFNGYEPGDNVILVDFTNTSNYVVAPTSYVTNYKPFLMMFGFGTILLGLIVPPVVMFRRRREEEE